MIKSYKEFLNESKFKDVGELYKDDFEEIFKSLKKDFTGWKVTVYEKDKYHRYCPIGFDLTIVDELKRIHMDVCLKNETSRGLLIQTMEDELDSHFRGDSIIPPHMKEKEIKMINKIDKENKQFSFSFGSLEIFSYICNHKETKNDYKY